MSLERITLGTRSLSLASFAMVVCLGLASQGLAADFDKKPTGFAIVGPTAKDAMSDAPSVVSPAQPAPSSAHALPQGLPSSSAPTATSVVRVENAPPAPGPLGLKTPKPVVDATHSKPDYYPMLPGVFGRPDNNVGMVLGVVLPIDSKDK